MSMKRLPVCNTYVRDTHSQTGRTCSTLGCHHEEYKHYMTDEELALYGLKRMVKA